MSDGNQAGHGLQDRGRATLRTSTAAASWVKKVTAETAMRDRREEGGVHERRVPTKAANGLRTAGVSPVAGAPDTGRLPGLGHTRPPAVRRPPDLTSCDIRARPYRTAQQRTMSRKYRWRRVHSATMRLAHVRERNAPMGTPWRLAAAMDVEGGRWLDLEAAAGSDGRADPRLAHNSVLFRQPVTTLDAHLARGTAGGGPGRDRRGLGAGRRGR